MLKIKHGVDVNGIKSEILLGLYIANTVFLSHSYDCVLTAGVEGDHKDHSHHKKGLAIDIRSRHIHNEALDSIVNTLRECLGAQYQVIAHTTHIHIEYDPV